MKRHFTWAFPALLTIVDLATLFAIGALTGTADDGHSGEVTAVGIAQTCLLLVFLAGTVFTVVRARRYCRAYRRSTGRITRAERQYRERVTQLKASTDASWNNARMTASSLTRGERLTKIDLSWLVLQDGEEAYVDTAATYSRYYGGDGTYMHVNGLFLGSASFVTAGLATTVLANKMQRDAARADAIQRWRELQSVRLIVTNYRILCYANGRWLSFYYGGVVAFYPEPLAWSLVLEFSDTEPLRLMGHAAPTVCAFAVWALSGPHGLRGHPAMSCLFAEGGPPPGTGANPYQRST